MQAFKKADFNVVREHEEFVWLHDHFVGNEELAGFIVGFCGKYLFMSMTAACFFFLDPDPSPTSSPGLWWAKGKVGQAQRRFATMPLATACAPNAGVVHVLFA